MHSMQNLLYAARFEWGHCMLDGLSQLPAASLEEGQGIPNLLAVHLIHTIVFLDAGMCNWCPGLCNVSVEGERSRKEPVLSRTSFYWLHGNQGNARWARGATTTSACAADAYSTTYPIQKLHQVIMDGAASI